MSFSVEIAPGTTARLYRNVTCDGCGASLKNAGLSLDDGAWECLQPDDGLEIHLVGGYGMAIDPCGDASEADLTKLFCGACTKKLCEQWPAIAEVVIEHCSPTIGHHCSKERTFAWRTYSGCCDAFCAKCGRRGSMYRGLDVETDRYSRRVIDCSIGGCGYVGPGKFSWECDCDELARAAKLAEEDDARDK